MLHHKRTRGRHSPRSSSFLSISQTTLAMEWRNGGRRSSLVPNVMYPMSVWEEKKCIHNLTGLHKAHYELYAHYLWEYLLSLEYFILQDNRKELNCKQDRGTNGGGGVDWSSNDWVSKEPSAMKQMCLMDNWKPQIRMGAFPWDVPNRFTLDPKYWYEPIASGVVVVAGVGKHLNIALIQTVVQNRLDRSAILSQIISSINCQSWWCFKAQAFLLVVE